MTKTDHLTVSGAFDLMAKNTEISLGEYTTILQEQAEIERHLMQHIRKFSSVLHGAFSRKTIVSPLPGSIVDMLIVFREDDIKDVYPSRLSAKLNAVLAEGYPDAYTLKDQSALMLPVKNFEYKIRPAYSISNNKYMLPDVTFDGWVKYNINSYDDIFVKENVRHKGQLIEVIRMIKTWNRASGNIFNGYYLELMVTDVLSSYEITSYSEAICHIFKTAFSEAVFQQHDPANLEFPIDGLNNIDDLLIAMRLIKKSYHLANDAIAYEQDVDTEKALRNWNKIFPQTFPTAVDMLVGKARRSGIKGADALKMMLSNR
jgi:hypothetical protein